MTPRWPRIKKYQGYNPIKIGFEGVSFIPWVPNFEIVEPHL